MTRNPCIGWAIGLLLALAATSGAAQVQSTTAPDKIWTAAGGYYSGYKSSSELLGAENAASAQSFNDCVARLSVNPYWQCGQLTMSGIRPDPANSQTYNGSSWSFIVNASWHYVGVDQNHQPINFYQDASNNYSVYSNLVCPTQHGFYANTVTVSPNNFQVTCIKYSLPAISCPCGSDGKGGSAPPGSVGSPPGKSAGGAAPGGVGNPIQILNGTKTEAHIDFDDVRGLLSVRRDFVGQKDAWRMPGDPAVVDAYSGSTSMQGVSETTTGQYTDGFGVTTQRVVGLSFPYIRTSTYGEIYVNSADGGYARYTANASGSFPTDPSGDRVEYLSSATAEGATIRIRRWNDVIDEFGPDGQQRRRQMRDGPYVLFGYSGGLLTSMTDNWGRQLSIARDINSQTTQVTLPDTSTISYAFSGKLLNTVTYQDGTTRKFLYNESAYIPSGGQSAAPYALTGSIDENNVRVGTYRYDSSGNATSTEGAGGVNKYTIASYGTFAQVTSPLSVMSTIYFTTVRATSAVSYRYQPAGAGSAASNQSFTYDANGNITGITDFNGNLTCYGYDATRNLETARVEGLSSSTGCGSSVTVGATLSAGVRKVSTAWHPDWRLASKVAQAGRLMTSVYNGQPDPFSGNALASCAPGTAVLPDGKPIAVLCKQVEQATTDTDGHLGFTATLQSGVANRIQSWTYNQYGQVLTAKGPRDDVNDTTTYAYFASTSFTGSGLAATGHRMGDLSQVTNPAGQTTQYVSYNLRGQLLQMIDANSKTTTYQYDARQRLKNVNDGGRQTSYTYDLAGQLRFVTWPDGTQAQYTYDNAHRLVGITDQAGNSVTYTLDNAGNRTTDQIKDPGGTLSRTVTRAFDALSRVQQVVGAAN